MRKLIINYNFFLFLILILNSCSISQKLNKNIEGIYIRSDIKNIKLYLFSDGSFSLVDSGISRHKPLYKCCDTLTYGNWKSEYQGFISLSSPREFDDYVNLIVEESSKEVQKDSITFIINNPIEEHYEKYNEKYREISYDLDILTNNDLIDKSLDSNICNISVDQNIVEFNVYIQIECDIPLKNSLKRIYTYPYKVKNPKSKLFTVDIPRLNYRFLSLMRLNQDYVKIINDDKLLWDGVEYLRSGNGTD